tara:strand:- start:1000 stop:1398 length:399 start_codon:yes stop_codon:yes gene_type:complete
MNQPPVNLIKDVDYIVKKITRQMPDYDTNIASAVAKHHGGMRPEFDNYILANSTGAVNEANQISQILQNFDYKCKQMTSNLPVKIGGSKRHRKYSHKIKQKRSRLRRKSKRQRKSRLQRNSRLQKKSRKTKR